MFLAVDFRIVNTTSSLLLNSYPFSYDYPFTYQFSFCNLENSRGLPY